LGNVVAIYEQILLLGEFNIPICCPNKLLTKYFCNLLDSLDFSQYVQCPTHVHGHILDFVFAHGFSITDMDIRDNGFSYKFSSTACEDFSTAYKAANELLTTK